MSGPSGGYRAGGYPPQLIGELGNDLTAVGCGEGGSDDRGPGEGGGYM